ncbi:C40 family peptidase [Fluviicola taffensis]|uniref:NLP/P60 protein n=1 Tax=Fluviicola taffensis (strain DSM 16823 / NCIMB 13979 / RW262) TaxID=755732 RepID=F2III3_FLUTR|nr:C40 family peptidase [Fluviicola taffensis]AEA44909.1 NLP/P60 protein [Fluviicola taffensis DSM 16823]
MSLKTYIFSIAVILMSNVLQAQAANGSLALKSPTASDTMKTQLLGVNDSAPKINKQVEEIIQFAKKFLGTPYHYAGSTPSGFDCSGFIYYVMGNFGMRLSRSSPGLAEFGKTVKLTDLQPGDLMFFKGRNTGSSGVGHVAMVVEVKNGVIRFIHSSTSRGVIIDTFNNSGYYVPRYLKSKRLDYGGITPKN